MTRGYRKMIFATSTVLCLTLGGVGSVYANGALNSVDTVKEYTVVNNGSNALDGLGGSGTQQNTATNKQQTTANTPQDNANKDSAGAVGDLFQNAGVDKESVNQANTFLEPLARGINIVVSFLLGFTSVAIFLITASDLLYIGFPPVRNMLNPQSQGGGGMGGYGGGGQQSTGIRWVSDEAMACVGGGDSGGGMGGPMGGQQQQGGKSVIMSYLKKRTVFLIMFAICVILFTSTVFTDLGLKLGMLLLEWITGASGSIPI